ncbi:MAG TPA: M48 family metallopeptidase [Verrucomicrobiae bacterium]
MSQEAHNLGGGGGVPVGAVVARTYEGGAFHPAFPNGRGGGVITVGSLAIRFTGKAGDLEMPIAGLNITLGGASDRILFFKHPSMPDTALHTADHNILKETAINENPAFKEQLTKVQGKKSFNLAVWLSVVGVVLALVVGLFAARDPMVNAVTNQIPPEWEVKLGETVFESMTAANPPIEDPVLAKHLEALTGPLLKGIGEQPYPFKFHIVEEPTINAFALPGGHVVIHSELILKAKSPEEVAGVLAHEIAHVTNRHSVRNIVKSTGTYFLFQFLFGDVGDLVGVFTSKARYLLNQKHSRDHEREADDMGWEYLVKADVNPRGMISFFETLAKEHEAMHEVQEALAFMSTHPATSERIARLEEKAKGLPKDKKYPGFDLNFEAFQNSLRAKLKTGGEKTEAKSTNAEEKPATNPGGKQ